MFGGELPCVFCVFCVFCAVCLVRVICVIRVIRGRAIRVVRGQVFWVGRVVRGHLIRSRLRRWRHFSGQGRVFGGQG